MYLHVLSCDQVPSINKLHGYDRRGAREQGTREPGGQRFGLDIVSVRNYRRCLYHVGIISDQKPLPLKPYSFASA
ncbi:hypothetical protein BI334_27735 [Moorena producens 3L]|nr:hypothetical protein BI334_27735 [Moorena producens 3L]